MKYFWYLLIAVALSLPICFFRCYLELHMCAQQYLSNSNSFLSAVHYWSSEDKVPIFFLIFSHKNMELVSDRQGGGFVLFFFFFFIKKCTAKDNKYERLIKFCNQNI